ncbi:MAG: 16S rRNA (adenine(1518)-N(6)/adenine(1519)-N(6))-dimethyltransferase RsmA [Phototrophicaceae bacterium]
MNPKQLLDQYNLEPRKGLGQNFLHDPNMLDKIIKTADAQNGERLLEVGPGTGALTVKLAESHPDSPIVAVEIDRRLEPVLSQTLAPYPNVRVIYEDFLRVNLNEHFPPDRAWKVVANIPYYITSDILWQIFACQHRPNRVVLTLQYEIGERICSKPNDMSRLAVMVQFYGQPQLVAKLPSAVFWPRPEVDSAILRVETHPTPPIDIPSEKLFFQVVKAGFSQKRKQLRNSLSSGLALASGMADQILQHAQLDPKRRAETLTLEEWGQLTRAVAEHMPD